MARLRNEEWLHLAKGIPVGGQRRYRHGRESRENLVVGNKDDRWWCYCMSCKCGAVEQKSHVLLVAREPEKSRDLSLPYDMKPVQLLPRYQQEYVAKFLALKNMDMHYMPKDTAWSAERQRLMVPTHREFRTGAGYNGLGGMWVAAEWMGRDTSGKSPQKWLTYNGQHYVGGTIHGGGLALLVEDMFSYLKVQRALVHGGINAEVYCTLGTAIHDSLFLELLQHHSAVASFYDGDAAGLKGCADNALRLRAAGIGHPAEGVKQIAPPELDPKDMDIEAIRAHVGRLYSQLN